MADFREYIRVWYKYTTSNINPETEDPIVLAGREAENVLRTIIHENYQFRGCHSFSSKRIYNPQVNHKHEIDLIVVTDKKLHIMECKNWRGSLVIEKDKWVQIRRNNDRVEHDNVLNLNEVKKDLLISTLKNHGITVNDSACEQKIILMNRNLKIQNTDINGNEKIITPDRLHRYLNKQDNKRKSHEILLSAIINLLLDDESAVMIFDAFFPRVGGKDHDRMIKIIENFPTWDKIVLYGTKILSGDIIEGRSNYSKNSADIPWDKVKSVRVKIIRSAPLLFIKAILCIGKPLGLDLHDNRGKFILETEANPEGTIRFVSAGQPDHEDISILRVDEIIYGKTVQSSIQPSTQFVSILSSPQRSQSPPDSGRTIAIVFFAAVVFLLFMLYKPDIGKIIDNIARYMPSNKANGSPNGNVALKQVNTVCLNLRAAPGVHSQVITRLPQGTYLTFLYADFDLYPYGFSTHTL